MMDDEQLKDQIIARLLVNNQRLVEQNEKIAKELLAYKSIFLRLDRLAQTVEHNNLTEFLKDLFHKE